MQEFEDPFENGYGHVNLENNFMAQLLRRYPRRGTPILEKAFDLRLMLSRILSQMNRASALSPSTRNVLILGVEVPSQPEYAERYDGRAEPKSWEARDPWRGLARWSRPMERARSKWRRLFRSRQLAERFVRVRFTILLSGA